MTLAMNLPPCGSSLSIYRYDGDGGLFPTTALLKDEDGQYWKFEFNCPAELSDIPPDDFKEQREQFMSKNAKQKKLEKYQEQDDSSFSPTNELMKNERPGTQDPANEQRHFALTRSWKNSCYKTAGE